MKILESRTPPPGWGELAVSDPFCSAFQSSSWSDFNKALGRGSTFIFDQEKNWGMLFLNGFHPSRVLVLNSKIFSNLITSGLHFLGANEFIGGPISSGKKERTEILKEFLEYFSKRRVVLRGTLSEAYPSEEMGSILREYHYAVRDNFTLKVNLQCSKEEAHASLEKKGRKAVRLAQEAGVSVSLAKTEQDVREYYEMLRSWRAHLSFQTGSFKGLKDQWNFFHSKNTMEVFIARWKGKPVAGMGIMHYNGNAIEVMSAQSQINYEQNLFAGDLIKWKIIEWGIEKGLRSYDLGGVNPNPTTEKEKNILQFKSKWGGELIKRYEISKNTTEIPFFGR